MLGSFNIQYLNDVLRKALSISSEERLNLSITRSDLGESASLLLVESAESRRFVTFKVLNHCVPQNDGQSNSILQPLFTFEDKKKEIYGAFEETRFANYLPPKRNNVNHLEMVLKSLAQSQAKLLNSSKDDAIISNSSNLQNIVDRFLSIGYFSSIEKSKITKTIKQLENHFQSLSQSRLVVKSVWFSQGSNVFVNDEKFESLFLDNVSQFTLPPAYDALLYIFSLSDEEFRKKFFAHLKTFYFKSLTEAIKKENYQLFEEVTSTYWDFQITTLLPVVKLKIAEDLVKVKEPRVLEEVLTNISNYMKYPLIQQEHVYEATRNKLLSDDYHLLGYTLIPLKEKNGHLGEYFHLRISIKSGDAERNITLFTKILAVDVDTMQEVAQRVGKKEEFFYDTLLTLFRDNGLGELLDFAPNCYLIQLSGEFMILEDLENLGYRSARPNSVLNNRGLRIVLKKLAKLHASSLITEEIISKQTGRKFRLGEEFEPYIEEGLLKYEGTMQVFFDKGLISLNHIIRKCPDLTRRLNISEDQVLLKLKDLYFSAFWKVKKSNIMRNVINHGDLYISNVLFKFSENDSVEVEDAYLIDYQMLRYTPPAYEVLFFIFVSSTRETREKHLNSLLDWYYENLSDNLRSFNLEPEEIIPRAAFDDDVNFVKSASLSSALGYGHFTKIDADFREELFRDPEKNKYYLVDNREEFIDLVWKDEHYRDVMRGLIEDFVDFVENNI